LGAEIAANGSLEFLCSPKGGALNEMNVTKIAGLSRELLLTFRANRGSALLVFSAVSYVALCNWLG